MTAEQDQSTFQSFLEKHITERRGSDSLQKLRATAWERFLALGLPTRKTEQFRSLRLKPLFSPSYSLAEPYPATLDQIAPFFYLESHESVIVCVNGHFSPILTRLSGIPSQVVVCSLNEAMKTYGTFLTNFWGKLLKEETDPFVTINQALHPEGVFIYIPPNTKIDSPIQILHLVDSSDEATLLLPRTTVYVGNHSEVTLLQTKVYHTHSQTLTNDVVEFAIENEAHVRYVEVQSKSHPNSWSLNAIRAHLKRGSTFLSVNVNENQSTTRHDIRVTLSGENAEASVNGVWMLSDKRESHTNIIIDHQAPHCRSYQLFKGVLNDLSRSSFEGKILVRKEAQKTDAFQVNNNLLLGEHAHADSKPNLEIFADDVKASHGSTIGQLDQDQLFYMQTRGLKETDAKKLLIRGFCEEVLDKIPILSLKAELFARMNHTFSLDEG